MEVIHLVLGNLALIAAYLIDLYPGRITQGATGKNGKKKLSLKYIHWYNSGMSIMGEANHFWIGFKYLSLVSVH